MASATLVALLVGSTAVQLTGTGSAIAVARLHSVTTLTPPGQSSRPVSGSIVRSSGGTGPGVLVVENGAASDGVASLATGGKVVRSVYVRQGETARVRNVPDGAYEIYLMLGSQWNGSTGRFGVDAVYQRFDTGATFSTERTKSQIRYTIYTISLQSVPDGTATVSTVPPESYPS